MTLRAVDSLPLLPRPAMPAKRAAETIGCDLSRIYKLMRQGKLEGYRDGRAVRIFADSIAAYQARDAISAPATPPPRHTPKASHKAHAAAIQALRGMGIRI